MYPWHVRKYSIVSGGFDPIHEGHIFNIIEAAKMSDGVIVLLNSDDWLTRKKGKFFQNMFTRNSILENIKGVIKVYTAKHAKIDETGFNSYFTDDDGTVCDGLRRIKEDFPNNPLIFCKGGDRVEGKVPEIEVCKELGIDVKYEVGGGKINSSSDLLRNWKKEK